MVKNIFMVMVSLLLGAVAFFGVRYANISREKTKIEQEFKEVKEEIGVVGLELQQDQRAATHLYEEKASLLQVLKDLEGKFTQLQAKNGLSQRHIFSLIKEIKNLQGNRKTSRERIALLEKENAQINAQLNSLPGLKNALKAFKKKMREERIAQLKQLRLEDDIVDGNLGYLVKDGASTYTTGVKIEVKTLQ